MTWDEAKAQGWTLRLGSTPRVLVAVRGDQRIYATSERKLLHTIATTKPDPPRWRKKETP